VLRGKEDTGSGGIRSSANKEERRGKKEEGRKYKYSGKAGKPMRMEDEADQ
jgi:hypothetical protein